MKILAKGRNMLRLISNQTPKIRDITVRTHFDRKKDITVLKVTLQPFENYYLSGVIMFSTDIRIAGKGSRGALFIGETITWTPHTIPPQIWDNT